MYCGVVPTLFGWFLKDPFLHALVFIQKTFCDLFLLFFFYCFFIFFRSSKREERQARGRCMVCRV